MSTETLSIPKAFVWRRLHSLMGLWIVLFLMEHLLTNSQAALWLGDNGQGFVRMVNWLHNLPYLQVIEVTLLGVPILVHMVLGVKYLFTSKANSSSSDGSKPSLKYSRNRAYTWQRITSWILLVGLIGHVAKFRFIDFPETIKAENETFYYVTVSPDPGIQSVAEKLEVLLIENGIPGLIKAPPAGKITAITPNFGTATLMTVRDTFKSPLYVFLYTIFVLAACFHACNGLWTFLITWGVIFKMTAQKAMVKFSYTLMAIIAFLGLIAIWGTYWLNLKY